MKPGALAMATALVLAEAKGARENRRWKRGSVNNPDSVINNRTWQNLMVQAGVILNTKPALAVEVVAGTLAIDAAYKGAKEERDHQADLRATRISTLTEKAPKYLRLLEEETLTIEAAWAAYEEETRKDRELAEAEDRATRQIYDRITQALLTLSSYTTPVTELMAKYDPKKLDLPGADRRCLGPLCQTPRAVSGVDYPTGAWVGTCAPGDPGNIGAFDPGATGVTITVPGGGGGKLCSTPGGAWHLHLSLLNSPPLKPQHAAA